MRLHPVALAATVVLSAGVASAQDRAGRFNQRDGNGDGLLSREEYTSTGGHPGNFRALDANGDGLLTRDEFVGREGVVEDQAYEGRAESRKIDPRHPDDQYPSDPNVLTKSGFRKIDRNGDAVLTKREWDGDSNSFRRLDANNDGYVSAAEYNRSSAIIGSTGAAAPLDNFRAKDDDRNGMLSREEYGEQRSFDRVDRNRDGWISADEFVNPPPAPGPGSMEYEFQARDRNRDGTLSSDEMGDRMFYRADGNRDGYVSYDEFRAAQGAATSRRRRY